MNRCSPWSSYGAHWLEPGHPVPLGENGQQMETQVLLAPLTVTLAWL